MFIWIRDAASSSFTRSQNGAGVTDNHLMMSAARTIIQHSGLLYSCSILIYSSTYSFVQKRVWRCEPWVCERFGCILRAAWRSNHVGRCYLCSGYSWKTSLAKWDIAINVTSQQLSFIEYIPRCTNNISYWGPICGTLISQSCGLIKSTV